MLSAKNLEIERLRAFAVLSVMAFHLGSNFPGMFSRNFGSSYGVDLFFVISGFVVSSSFFRSLRKMSEQLNAVQSRTRLVLAFYIRRAFRILPLAFVCMLFFVIFYIALKDTPNLRSYKYVPQSIWSILTLRYNFDFISHPEYEAMGFFWTLVVEEHFYLLMPLMMVALKSDRARLGWSIFGILVVQWFLRPYAALFAAPETLHSFMTYASPLRFDEFFLGVVVALLRQERASKTWAPSLIQKVFINFAIWVPLLCILFFSPFSTTKWALTPFPFILLSCGALTYLASFEVDVVLGIPGLRKLLEYIGSRSYGLYLWHCPVIFMLSYFRPQMQFDWASPASLVIMVLIMSLSMTEVTYQLVEKPFLSLGKKVSQDIWSENQSAAPLTKTVA